MILRRAWLAAVASSAIAVPVGAATPRLPVPPSGGVSFRLIRNGTAIGTHTLTFVEAGDALTVTIAIDILVKFGPIPVYRYNHRATETWQDGRFVGLASTTDSDGTPLRMRASMEPEGLVVEGTRTQRYVAPPMTFATTYWNKAMLQPQVINSEDGRLFDVTPTTLAEEAVRTAAGTLVRARRHRLAGDLRLDLWYDATDRWAHLEFTKDGSTVIYEKL